MIRSIKRGVRSLQSRYLGNQMPLQAVFLHAIFDGLVTVKSMRQSTTRQSETITPTGEWGKLAAEELRRNGYLVIPPSTPSEEISLVRKKIDSLLETRLNRVETLADSNLIRLRDSAVNVPEVLQFILGADASSLLRAFYSTDFSIISCDIYRTLEMAGERESFDSEDYHFDNGPRSMVKVLVYLSGAERETGAMTLLPRKSSAKIRRNGFWDRKEVDRFKSEIEANSIVLEGPPGTMVVFLPQFCIHKATLPRLGYRDVAAFLVHPRLTEVSGELTQKDLVRFSRSYGYLVNPFTDRTLRWGSD